MLASLGKTSVDELFDVVPENVRLKRELDIPGPSSEMELMREMYRIAGKNIWDLPSFLGAGAYRHYIPSVVGHILSRSEFYTAYTPYQAEISQGMLQAIFEYQTLICQLTGMDASNASVYDGATAAAEAAVMAVDITRRKKILVSRTVHPETRSVIKTYCTAVGFEMEEIPWVNGQTDIERLKDTVDGNTAAVLIQHPNFFGCLEDMDQIGEITYKKGALFIACVDPISLGLLKPPAEYAADIAVGEGQSLGNRLSFGGPYLGFMAAKEKYMRKLPGRIVGQTTDHEGNRGFVLTLQAREQHIRREKALSNICSNQALNALAAAVYLTVMGKQGISETADLCLQKSHYAFERLKRVKGLKAPFTAPFFKEFVIQHDRDPVEINKQLLEQGIIGGYALQQHYPELMNHSLYCVTEMNTKDEMDKLAGCLEVIA